MPFPIIRGGFEHLPPETVFHCFYLDRFRAVGADLRSRLLRAIVRHDYAIGDQYALSIGGLPRHISVRHIQQKFFVLSRYPI